MADLHERSGQALDRRRPLLRGQGERPAAAAGASVLDPYTPRFLPIESAGYGPRGAAKVMKLLVDRNYFDFTPKSTLLMRGAADCSNMPTFEIGNSNAKEYNGNDGWQPAAGVAARLRHHLRGNNTQATTTVNSSKPNTVTTSPAGKVSQLTNSDLPNWLQNANDARAFLLGLARDAPGRGALLHGPRPPASAPPPARSSLSWTATATCRGRRRPARRDGQR